MCKSRQSSFDSVSNSSLLHVDAHLHLKHFVVKIEGLLLVIDDFDMPLDVVSHVLLKVAEILRVLMDQVSICALPLTPLLADACLMVRDAL